MTRHRLPPSIRRDRFAQREQAKAAQAEAARTAREQYDAGLRDCRDKLIAKIQTKEGRDELFTLWGIPVIIDGRPATEADFPPPDDLDDFELVDTENPERPGEMITWAVRPNGGRWTVPPQ